MSKKNSVVAFGIGFLVGKKGLEFGERFLYWFVIVALGIGLASSQGLFQ